MRILAIDPGNTESAYVEMDGYRPVRFGKVPNENLLEQLDCHGLIDLPPKATVIEMVASYGMAVGKEVFDTCVWIGRFTQASFSPVKYIYRMEEKMTICHDSKAKDSNIRQALIDRFAEFDTKNGKGTKAKPDWFYGFSKDVWSAYAVGVTFLDREQEKVLQR